MTTDLATTILSESDLLRLGQLAIDAGAEIMRVYEGEFDVQIKGDQSPLTQADLASHAVIADGLARDFGHIPVVSEEDADSHNAPEGETGPFFLVDPLDGTKEFINRRPDFTVNIALIEQQRPTYGIIYAPVRKALYIGDVVSGKAHVLETEGLSGDISFANFKALTVRKAPDALAAVCSLSHNSPETEAYLDLYGVAERVAIGSSLKFCLVAEGQADLYPRLGPTMEWDTAAGDAILTAAGGKVLSRDGAPLIYAKPRFFNPEFFAQGDVAFKVPN
ncbi:3'(2'),5'-bisphosphate nucleotidase CysQ [Asticcacaulis endophyticus]|uniref:3'(2'),5'-bisphosphate nucleotidase CysQ n=1 Tax=Asticcacaulis endophyticus TaxID=1395890 RepID=A0A918PTF4_9CAUL|nr:3'(2'),5'-bisphosphate nucleotidase CysQ [Asticcacaulis endophyticus]GGZ21421.1 3'(2'),5'-bisphosphate nucleotidase CysQ [Asticcacaulis endophyticus]